MLMNTWYVAGLTEDVTDKPKQVKLLSQDFVLFRDEAGALHCLSDICIHRGASLSAGRVTKGCIECPYHGWRYRGDGSAAEIPAHPGARIPKRVRVDSYPVQERFLNFPNTMTRRAAPFAAPSPGTPTMAGLSRTASTLPTPPLSTRLLGIATDRKSKATK
jgi:phenylpropionate dioxygenase-like ring-hydroxylating dioxygenase large terminal subunit